MASTATGCLAEKSSADVIIQIAKPVLRQKKLYLITKRVFDIVCSFLGLLILAIPMMTTRCQVLRGLSGVDHLPHSQYSAK